MNGKNTAHVRTGNGLEPNGDGIWFMKWFAKSLFERCFPIRQPVLNVSQVAVTFHRIRPSNFRPIHNNIADVPSLILRSALSSNPFVSERRGIDVQ